MALPRIASRMTAKASCPTGSVGGDIIRSVEEPLVDLRARHKAVDLHNVGALNLDRFQLRLIHENILTLGDLVAAAFVLRADPSFFGRDRLLSLALLRGLSEDTPRHVSCNAVWDRRELTMMTPIQFYLALVGALLIFEGGAQAQNYPNRTITIVVPFPPGGLTDVPARVFAAMLQQKIDQNLVIENKTGGNGTIGVAYVSRAAPDGYTLLANSLADAQNVHFVAVPYSPINDFAQVGWIVDGPPAVLVVQAALPYKTLADLIADAKKNPSKISFGTSGPASSPAMALAQLNKAAGIQIVGVPYRGSGEAAREVAAGAIQGVFTFYAQGKPLVEDGKLRALAVAAPERLAGWPDVPTFGDLGYDIDFRGFVGLVAPAKTPKPIIDYLNKELNAVVQSEPFKRSVGELGMMVPADNTPEKYDAYLRAETVRQGEIAKLTGAALQK
jgi:tripartite-type tricarboxylate transporter receptor subunit TctC